MAGMNEGITASSCTKQSSCVTGATHKTTRTACAGRATRRDRECERDRAFAAAEEEDDLDDERERETDSGKPQFWPSVRAWP